MDAEGSVDATAVYTDKDSIPRNQNFKQVFTFLATYVIEAHVGFELPQSKHAWKHFIEGSIQH